MDQRQSFGAFMTEALTRRWGAMGSLEEEAQQLLHSLVVMMDVRDPQPATKLACVERILYVIAKNRREVRERERTRIDALGNTATMFERELQEAQNEADDVQRQRDAARAEVERLQVQLAGVTTALDGHRPEPPCVQGDYGWSLPYQQAMELRAEAERLRKAAEAVLEHACWFARKTPMAGNAIVSNLPQLRAALDGEDGEGE